MGDRRRWPTACGSEFVRDRRHECARGSGGGATASGGSAVVARVASAGAVGADGGGGDGSDGEVTASSGSESGCLVGRRRVHVTGGTTRVRTATSGGVPGCSGCN